MSRHLVAGPPHNSLPSPKCPLGRPDALVRSVSGHSYHQGPFDITTEYPTRVAGVAMPTYIDGIRSAWYVSLMSCPIIIVPVGFSANGLPAGAQIASKRRPDFA